MIRNNNNSRGIQTPPSSINNNNNRLNGINSKRGVSTKNNNSIIRSCFSLNRLFVMFNVFVLSLSLLWIYMATHHTIQIFNEKKSNSSTEGNLRSYKTALSLINSSKGNNNNNINVNDGGSDNNNNNNFHVNNDPKFAGREKIVNILKTMNINPNDLDDDVWSEVPSWDTITNMYGDKPIVYGIEEGMCRKFQDAVPPINRHGAISGMFNTGTNVLHILLQHNCYIPERIDAYKKQRYHGMEWQVAWGKHTLFRHRNKFIVDKVAVGSISGMKKTKDFVNKTNSMPLVTIRDPYNWMLSMCRNPYFARWAHSAEMCPNLWNDKKKSSNHLTLNLDPPMQKRMKERQNPNYKVSAEYNATLNNIERLTEHDSLVHLWNDWNNDYMKQRVYPFLMVRFEDLIFFPREVTEQVCTCIGGSIRDKPDDVNEHHDFYYHIDTAKVGPGHYGNQEDSSVKARPGLIDAWIKYGKPIDYKQKFSKIEDLVFANKFLDKDLMNIFQYHHPSKDNGYDGETIYEENENLNNDMDTWNNSQQRNAKDIQQKKRNRRNRRGQPQKKSTANGLTLQADFAEHDISRTLKDENDPVFIGREKLYHIIKETGEDPLSLGYKAWSKVPVWDEITKLWGKEPVIYGEESCEAYRNMVPPVNRRLGTAGLFSTGTNALSILMEENCYIPERVGKFMGRGYQKNGMAWQVPWGKHTLPRFRLNHTIKVHGDWSWNKEFYLNQTLSLPIVTIRDPYNWMKSMCRVSYTANWPHKKVCPHLWDITKKTNVEVRLNANPNVTRHPSLAGLWNNWYNDYFKDANYPLVIIRFEDLMFHPKETIERVCKCGGGKLRDKFKYQITSSVTGKGHGNPEKRTGLIEGWMKYGKDKNWTWFPPQDLAYAEKHLDADLMNTFRYHHKPPSASDYLLSEEVS